MTALTENQRMEYAHQIADAAACFDDIQSPTTSTDDMLRQLRAARGHVESLQKIAHFLAGDRAHEIFAPEDGADVFTEESQTHFLQRFREVC